MECLRVMGKCRACRIKTQKEFQIPIFGRENLLQIFREVTSLEIHENDKFPGILCDECHSRLLDAHKFRQMCFSSAFAFQQILSGECDSDFEEKYKPPELVDVPGEGNVMPPDQDIDFPEEKFNPLESLIDTEVFQEEDEEDSNLSEPLNIKNENLFQGKGTKRYHLKNDTDPLRLLEGVQSSNSTRRRKQIKYVEDGDFACKICNKVYIKKSSLKSHLRSHHRIERGLPVLECKICGKTFKRSLYLNLHTKRKHIHSCDHCELKFTTRAHLRRHKNSHTGVVGKDSRNKVKKVTNSGVKINLELTCALCEKTYANKESIWKHMRFVHLKIVQCKICGKKFTRPASLKGHMVRKHGDTGMLKCLECGKLLSTPEGLTYHMSTWHDPKNPREIRKKPGKNIICEHCGKSLWSRAELIRHFNTHAGIMPFKCQICPRAYARKDRLKLHMMGHEGIKNHVCTVCGLRKTTITQLKVHMNIHTKERIFACKLCPKTFLAIGGLSRHTKVVHQGIKAFPCPHCERSFGKKETLKHHVMTHTGEKPHECDKCGRRFIQPTALQTHMKTHKKK